jgi:DNA polymerase-1
MIKLAMLAIRRRLRAENSPAQMLLQIHDELIFEAPESEIDSLAKLVREEMQNVLQLRVPLKVDVKTGANWAACE